MIISHYLNLLFQRLDVLFVWTSLVIFIYLFIYLFDPKAFSLQKGGHLGNIYTRTIDCRLLTQLG